MQSEIIHQGSVIGEGRVKDNDRLTFMVTLHLGAVAGTATASVFGRSHANGPWKLLGTLDVDGANAQDNFTVVNEAWPELYANIDAIAGGATATIVIGG